MSNSISISHLDIEAQLKLAELLGESGNLLASPDDSAPLTVTITGAQAWVEYGKWQKVDTKKLLAVLSKGQVSEPMANNKNAAACTCGDDTESE